MEKRKDPKYPLFPEEFGAPFVIQERKDAPFTDDHMVLNLTGPLGPDGRVRSLAVVHALRINGPYFEVVEIRPVLDEEQTRPLVSQIRKELMMKRF